MRRLTIAAVLLFLAGAGCYDEQAERAKRRDEWIATEKARIDAGETHVSFYSTLNTNVLLHEISGNPTVEDVSFQQTQDLDPSGFAELARFPNLRSLRFYIEPALDSKTIQYVAACEGLEELTIDATHLDSGGLRTIATIDTLKTLTLRPNGFEAFAMEDVLTLSSLKNLKDLYLGGASLEAVEALRNELPDCKIVDADAAARRTGESRFWRDEEKSP